MKSRSSLNITSVAIIALTLIFALVFCAGLVLASGSENGTVTEPTSPAPVTEQTSAGWSWLLLLGLIPMTGLIMYYYGIVRDR